MEPGAEGEAGGGVGGGEILLIAPLRALDKRGMRMTLALYSPFVLYPYDRADLAFCLAGASFAAPLICVLPR